MNVVVIRSDEGIIVGLDGSMLTANRTIGLGREQTSGNAKSERLLPVLYMDDFAVNQALTSQLM